jgi:hypothetical protein
MVQVWTVDAPEDIRRLLDGRRRHHLRPPDWAVPARDAFCEYWGQTHSG